MSTTIKLKNFEYSEIVQNVDESNRVSKHLAFDSPNGFVFVLAISDKISTDNMQVCDIINHRVQYYLENEVLDDALEAVATTMVYINGFLFEQRRKNPLIADVHAGLLCVLIKHQQVYYSWAGETGMLLYTGKKIISLTRYPFPVRDPRAASELATVSLGISRQFEPFVCSSPLVPVNQDAILLHAGGSWSNLRENTVVDILADSMPVNTKLKKLLKLATGGQSVHTNSAVLVSFYNLGQLKRSFAEAKTTVVNSADKVAEVMSIKGSLWKWRYLIILLAVLLASYMVYDLFLFNPVRPVPEAKPDATQIYPAYPADAAPNVLMPEDETLHPENQPASMQPVKLPDDIRYTVKAGDTWSVLYEQFEVCSWFIRNHAPNAGRFDARGNPRVNAVLMIPVKFSGNERLNPNFFREFTVDKVGNACQNANQAFIDRFMERVNDEVN